MARTRVRIAFLALVGSAALVVGLDVAGAQAPPAQGAASTTPAGITPAPAPPGPLDGACYASFLDTIYTPLIGGSFGVKVRKNGIAVAMFPDGMPFTYGSHSPTGFKVRLYNNIVTVTPTTAAVGDTANMVLTTGDFSVNMGITMSADEYTGLVRVKPVPREEYERRKRGEPEEPNGLGVCAGMTPSQRREAAARFLMDVQELQGRDGRVALVPSAGLVESSLASPGEIRAAISWAVKVHGERYGMVRIVNRTGQQVEITGVAIMRQGDYGGVAGEIFWHDSATTTDSTLVLDDNGAAHGVVVIPAQMGDSIDDMAVHFLGTGGVPVAIGEIIELYPLPEDEKRRRRMATQTTVGVRGVFGGFWTGPGDDLGGTDGTMMAGIGVRVGKGLHRLFAFEAEIIGGRSGEARFANVPWSGTMGDVVRQASFGRIQGNGVIRFGTELVASMRLGVGMQVASYDSTFIADGNLMDGPGDGLEVDGLWATGASLDARLGEHWSIGAMVNFVDAFNTDGRSLEGAIQIGYGINTKQSYF